MVLPGFPQISFIIAFTNTFPTERTLPHKLYTVSCSSIKRKSLPQKVYINLKSTKSPNIVCRIPIYLNCCQYINPPPIRNQLNRVLVVILNFAMIPNQINPQNPKCLIKGRHSNSDLGWISPLGFKQSVSNDRFISGQGGGDHMYPQTKGGGALPTSVHKESEECIFPLVFLDIEKLPPPPIGRPAAARLGRCGFATSIILLSPLFFSDLFIL